MNHSDHTELFIGPRCVWAWPRGSSPLLQFADQFKEVKEAARLAREKSQERFELANPGLNIAAPEVKLRAVY